ncbi:MAG: Lrp/AsnC family transcriptional regulator [Candidatus Lokiarchaeota archaeon]|nr:Lrp/AsnC family transcriptional regulator [Candidatus Lokiarchaeota archaeon]
MDEIDFKILKIIDNNCRISYSTIAEELDLSLRKVSQRLDSMIKDDVIKRFSVQINYNWLGLHHYIGSLNLSEEINIDNYYKNLQLIPEINKIWHLLDGTLIISFFIKTDLHLEQLINSISKSGASFNNYNEIVYNDSLQDLYTSTDWRIIQFLMKNSRASNKEIAHSIGISAKTVKRRINRMINKNLIRFTPEINFEAIKGMFTALASVKIVNSSKEANNRIKNENTIKFWRISEILTPFTNVFLYGNNLKEIYEMFTEMKNRTYINDIKLSFIIKNWENSIIINNAISEKLQYAVGFNYNKNLIN